MLWVVIVFIVRYKALFCFIASGGLVDCFSLLVLMLIEISLMIPY